jgi:hypothetical protein
MHEVIAVFDDEDTARTAGEAAEAALRSHPRVGEEQDAVTSLKAEMREELQHTTAGAGNVGPFTKEMTKGIAAGTPIGAVVGAVLALPLGLIPLMSIGLVPRLVIAAVVGAAAGATVGFMLGGFTAKGPAIPLAAERGTTIAIPVRTPEEIGVVTGILEGHGPIRIDLTTDEGNPVSTVATEEDPA